ncbi:MULTISPECIES: arabinofuranosidase catalytic domain-containing protein [Calothrix]|uniref:Alpha-L-arabinofuranosidase B catalytic domain-containing protein n=2 Tax=Calothrix TaxID=1186 RepID=A0ABR8AJF5_9CYAN|nr:MULTISPECIES: arabinofuranosidase catalytic domain-containing protein [Calothrix]MBD2200147.1 hypothetical protein [Calothrix parietina FACHB-288]MBD2229143.1 hypothetical protein [Calothrix anomala FACHB-343]
MNSELLMQLYGTDGFDRKPDAINFNLLNKKLSEDLGKYGGVVTTDTSTVTGSFSVIQILNDTVFSSITVDGVSGALTGYTIPAGQTIYGDITTYKLTSGKVLAYKSSDTPITTTPTLALDGYTNVVFAYSLTKLFSDYTGPCIRVRRSSDNAQQDIYFDSNGQLDITSLLDFVGSSNGFITVYYDQSPNNRNASQVDTSLQPQIITSGKFDSRGISFTNGSLFIDTSWLASDFTLLVKERATSISTNNNFIQNSTSISNKNIILGYADANTISATQFDSTLTYDNPSVNFPVNTSRVWVGTCTTSTKKVYLNGNQVATT